MEYLALIGTVTLVHLLAVISPGPDFIMTVKNSISYGRKSGILTAIGLGMGIFVHIFYCIAGLAIIISQSIIVFNIVKLLGAGYLIYIGFKSFTSKSFNVEIKDFEKQNEISIFQSIKVGFLTNVLNPKATLFFLSLFTLVISPNTPNSILAILSIIMVLNTILWFSIVAILFTQKKVISIFSRFQNIFNKVLGGLLIGLGVKIGLSQK